MQAASPAASKRRLRQRARLLVQGIDAAPAAEQTETGFDAGRGGPRVQADRQSAVIVDAASAAEANMQRIKCDQPSADAVKKVRWRHRATRLARDACLEQVASASSAMARDIR